LLGWADEDVRPYVNPGSADLHHGGPIKNKKKEGFL